MAAAIKVVWTTISLAVALSCNTSTITAQKKAIDIITAQKEAQAKAVEHVERFMELLAICYANIFTANDPHVVVLGGGLSNYDLIYEEMTKRVPKHLLSVAKCPKSLFSNMATPAACAELLSSTLNKLKINRIN